MHYCVLAAWNDFTFHGSNILVWFAGLIICAWVGIRWWSAHIAEQFEREQPLESETIAREEEEEEQKAAE